MSERFQSLPHPDNRHLEAAEGWLELGNWREAHCEVEQINSQLRAHPYVLEMRYKIHVAAKRWDMAMEVACEARDKLPEEPWGYFYTAYALHELKRTQEAYDALRAVVDKFPGEQIMRYNLACYSCQLGKMTEAMEWLQIATNMKGKVDIRELALGDKDLEPLWARIKKIKI